MPIICGRRIKTGNNMPDPFRLFFNLLFAAGKTAAYTFILLVQIAWYLGTASPSRIGDALGYYGRSVVDTVAEAFRSRSG